MATVFLARDLRHPRQVALKVLHPDLARAVGPERFLREIEILAGLNHPNILPLLDSGGPASRPAGAPADLLWYAMPFVAGESLRERLRRELQLPLDEALRIAGEVTSALEYAHRHNVVHRDIKPENILLQSGHAVVADFGIARAITRAGGDTLSSAGLAIGTPAYMSPEQSAGSPQVDGRSDIYSLGCVLYEMLAGEPPFTGPTPQSVSARHVHEPPPSLRVVRPGVPAGVQAVVERALAKVPADRFLDAGTLGQALKGGAAAAKPAGADHRRRAWAVLGVLLLVVVAGLVATRRSRGAAVDPSRYVVLPFVHQVGAAPALINGENCEVLVSDALARWTDLGVVSSLTVSSALAMNALPLTVPVAVDIAARQGAGRLLWGEVRQFGDSVRVTGTLYDVASGRELRSHTVRFPATLSEVGQLASQFAELTYALVLPGRPTPEAAAEALGANSLAAFKAYASGDSALNEWNLDLAKQRFRDALALDPDYPSANLKLAQVGEWQDDPGADWRPYAARAVAAEPRLAPPDRLMAEGLVALADGEYVAACQRYRAMVTRDTLDFRGWFGLGECLAKDEVVLPDPKSPSGWKFRGGYQSAITGYSKALTLVPLSHRAFGSAIVSRLSNLIPIESDFRRGGRRPSDSSLFVAYPTIDHDSLAAVPYEASESFTSLPTPPTNARAVAQGRYFLSVVTASWLAAFPKSVPALRARATVLELLGRSESNNVGDSPLRLIQLARSISTEVPAIRLAADEVRLLLKAGSFEAARSLADSVLGAHPNPTSDEADILAGLAALTGRVHQTATLLGLAMEGEAIWSPLGKVVQVSTGTRSLSGRLLAYASFRVPADSIRVLAERIAMSISGAGRLVRDSSVLSALIDRSALLSFPALPPPTGDYFIYRAESALRRNDIPAAARELASLERFRHQETISRVSIDALLLEIRLRVMMGMSADAVRRLDEVLAGLPALGTDLLSDAPQAAALTQAMVLRGQLALAVGDQGTGNRWLGTASTLWRHADPEVLVTLQSPSRPVVH